MAQQSGTTVASLNAQLSRPGSENFGADERALYLKLFSGEMFKGFQNKDRKSTRLNSSHP